jgi:NADPH-dependent 2,4-dienoyl-CoA reductase/sulfur reductase-like enzyme
MKRVLVIGGSDAGISAALRARECDASAQVSVVVADHFPNYSICGLPFYLSQEVPDWHTLAHRSINDIERQGIHLLLEHTAQVIDPEEHLVLFTDRAGKEQRHSYDSLVIATGATPVRPALSGLDLPGVFVLHTMQECLALDDALSTGRPRRVIILGGGYIGVEMADALTHRGLDVTIIDHHATLLKTVDPSLGVHIHQELGRHGVEVITGARAERILQEENHLVVHARPSFVKSADIVLVAVGVQPEAQLAVQAGCETGIKGALRVTRAMQTTISDIFAAGDCVETWHQQLQRPAYMPLGTTAHKQGRIAGENAVGGQRLFAGSLGTQVVKVFDLAIARTGLSDEEARAARFLPLTVETTAFDHTPYYPGAAPIHVRITGDCHSGCLLGAQLVGNWHAEIAKRIDIFATALFHQMPVEMLSDLDLSYTPPVSTPWDPIQLATQQWVTKQKQM